MASSADDLETKVAEALDEPLLVAIGAACSTPTQAANKCRELGITTEDEKLAKWVAVLKRDSQNLFGADFLGKLKEISDKKFPAEVKMEKETKNCAITEGIYLPPNPTVSTKKVEKELTKYDYEKLWDDHFCKFWLKRIKSKLAKYEFEGVPIIVTGWLKNLCLFSDTNDNDSTFLLNNGKYVYLNLHINVKGQGKNECFYFLLEIEGIILERSLVKKDAYKNAKLDILRIYANAPIPLKKATTLAKWLKTQKNLVKKVVVIKNFGQGKILI